MAKPEPLVEVRVPTYARPQLLQRALQALLAQTHRNWACTVFDDSPGDDTEELCRSLGDPRIIYRRNLPRRYAAENIDSGFQPPEQGEFAFLLEDDNLILPGFISENIRDMDAAGVNLLLRNQYVEKSGERSDWGILDRRFQEGLYALQEFLAAVFFSPVISNGGLFWRRSARSRLRVGHPDCGPVIQEYMRALAIEDAVLVARKPLGVWMDNGAQTTRDETVEGRRGRREELASIQSIRQAVYDALRRQGQLERLTSSRIMSPPARLERGVLEAKRSWPGASSLSIKDRLVSRAKGFEIGRHPAKPGLAEFLAVFARRFGAPATTSAGRP